jgi:hypothetical protein
MKLLNSRFGQLILLVGLFTGLALAWYLISPLFINDRVNEEFPTAVVFDPTAEFVATAEMEKAEAMGDTPVEEPMPTQEAEMQILAQGQFYDVAHHGAGSATIYQLADGSRVLRFESFEVLNGPDLHVYLTSETSVADRVGQPLAGPFDLGKLKGNVGDQNYDIPADLDLSAFGSVVIWCEPFAVPFSAAPLGAP